MRTKMFEEAVSAYTKLGQVVGLSLLNPSRAQRQCLLFMFGLALLALGALSGVNADGGDGLHVTYNDERLTQSVNAVLTYLEGSFGALVMVAAGLGAILASAFGQYRAALGCLVVAIGSFILRSVMSTFFNDIGIME